MMSEDESCLFWFSSNCGQPNFLCTKEQRLPLEQGHGNALSSVKTLGMFHILSKS